MEFSRNVLGVQESFLNRWDSIIKLRKLEGKDILQFNLGQPDFACPDFVKKIIEEVNQKEGNNFYNHTIGTEGARKAIVKFQKEVFNSEYSKDEVIITNGAKEAIFLAFAALLNPQDEVIAIAPHWPTYIEAVKFLGGKPIVVDAGQDFHLNIEAIKNVIGEKTRAIVINSPNNPSGTVYGEEEFSKIAELAVQNNLVVVSDEVYSLTIFDGKKHISIADFPGMEERTVLIDGFSKTLSMTGYRLGYALASREIISNMVKVKSNINGNTNSFFQMVLEEAILNHFDEFTAFVDFSREKYLERRDFLCEKLSEMGIEFARPDGTFYVFARIPEKVGKKSQEFAEYLLEQTGVAVAPGIFFGENYDNYFRISFGTSMEDVKKGVERMRKIL